MKQIFDTKTNFIPRTFSFRCVYDSLVFRSCGSNCNKSFTYHPSTELFKSLQQKAKQKADSCDYIVPSFRFYAVVINSICTVLSMPLLARDKTREALLWSRQVLNTCNHLPLRKLYAQSSHICRSILCLWPWSWTTQFIIYLDYNLSNNIKCERVRHAVNLFTGNHRTKIKKLLLRKRAQSLFARKREKRERHKVAYKTMNRNIISLQCSDHVKSNKVIVDDAK